MNINLKSNIKKLTKSLNFIQRQQIPFVSSRTINSCAFEARKDVQKSLSRYLEVPTQYTIRGVQVEKSTKKHLVAKVGFKGKGFGKGNGATLQAEYMERQIEGGIRRAKGTAIPVPVTRNFKINKYGNIPRGKINKLLKDQKKYFSGIPRGKSKEKAGLWERVKKRKQESLKMLIAWEPVTQYHKRFPFKSIVNKSVKKNFSLIFDRELRHALRTTRRRFSNQFHFPQLHIFQ